jgi:hypothetical protein
MRQDPEQYVIVIDHVPGQGWEAHIDHADIDASVGWESTDPITLLAAVARDLVINGDIRDTNWAAHWGSW